MSTTLFIPQDKYGDDKLRCEELLLKLVALEQDAPTQTPFRFTALRLPDIIGMVLIVIFCIYLFCIAFERMSEYTNLT